MPYMALIICLNWYHGRKRHKTKNCNHKKLPAHFITGTQAALKFLSIITTLKQLLFM
jgi:hypothetical protein